MANSARQQPLLNSAWVIIIDGISSGFNFINHISVFSCENVSVNQGHVWAFNPTQSFFDDIANIMQQNEMLEIYRAIIFMRWVV